VWLVPRGRLQATDPAVQGQATCTGPGVCATGVRVRADVRNRTAGTLPGRVRVTVRDPEGRTVAGAERDLGPIPPGGQAPAAVDLPVPDGRLWSPSSPVLYSATVQVLSGAGRVEQEVRRDVGLRGVTAQHGRLQLNGYDLRLRGASIQEDVPEHGAALTDDDVGRIVGELQAAGANVTRAHYTLDERLLSALDRAGIMVWEQAPVYQGTTALGRDDARELALRTNVRAVVATRNHPSVIVHSVANELSPVVDRHPGAVDYLARARADVEALDPTVPPAIDLVNYPGYARQAAYRAFPVLGLNTYFGWYTGRKGHETRRFEDFAPFLDRLRRQYPTQAMTITEMGAEGIRRGPVTRKGSFEFQTRYFRRLMNVIDARDDLSGALYWTLREFAVKPGWTGGVAPAHAKRGGIHRKGLLTYAGKPKPVWGVAARRLNGSVWAPGAPVRTAYGR
jgi:beta-glucuronidase